MPPKTPTFPLARPMTKEAAKAKLTQALAQAQALQRAGRLREAETLYQRVSQAAPKLPEPHAALAGLALGRGDAATALAHVDTALALRPDLPALLTLRAAALAATGDGDAALPIYDRLIKADPKAVKPRADKALLLQRMGAFDDADAELRRAIKRGPKEGALYRMAVATRKVAKGEPLLADMAKLYADPSITKSARMELGFALGKAMIDSGQHDKVFDYLDQANGAVRAASRYRVADRMAEVDGLIAAFEGADFSPLSPPEADSARPRPIFVTGLPRSGTTLVEQILASHAEVTAGGERRFLLAEAYRTMGDPARGFTPLRDLPDAALSDFATAYLDALARAVPDAGIVTDKSIQTHLVLGLVAKALPEATLIVVRRDPRDLGFSIYRNLFAPGVHQYAYDQEDIAAYIASFERMMAFWRNAIPGRFIELAYEDLVADPEPQTRALVAAAGLEWDPACLDFHKTERQVATLSIQQVRQPMHTGARGGWRRYADELAPMIAALEAHGVALP